MHFMIFFDELDSMSNTVKYNLNSEIKRYWVKFSKPKLTLKYMYVPVLVHILCYCYRCAVKYTNRVYTLLNRAAITENWNSNYGQLAMAIYDFVAKVTAKYLYDNIYLMCRIIFRMHPANERGCYIVTSSHWLGAYAKWSMDVGH